MIIKPISDLHFEHGLNGSASDLAKAIDDPQVDVLVIAGDLCEQTSQNRGPVENVLYELCERFPKVIYVAGNHEHWHNFPENVSGAMKRWEQSCPNLKVLHNDWYEYGGKRFYGGTGWYPLEFQHQVLFGGFSDSRAIKTHEVGASGKRALIEWIQGENATFKRGLTQCRKGDIVVSHHAPHRRSINAQYERNPYNCFYVDEQPNSVWEAEPALWIHGHHHHATSYMVNETQVVCNPRGWPHEKSGFNPNLIVEV
jgi:Icc-related predicted phosphoesterase